LGAEIGALPLLMMEVGEGWVMGRGMELKTREDNVLEFPEGFFSYVAVNKHST
jgi:hypothetical protein